MKPINSDKWSTRPGGASCNETQQLNHWGKNRASRSNHSTRPKPSSQTAVGRTASRSRTCRDFWGWDLWWTCRETTKTQTKYRTWRVRGRTVTELCEEVTFQNKGYKDTKNCINICILPTCTQDSRRTCHIIQQRNATTKKARDQPSTSAIKHFVHQLFKVIVGDSKWWIPMHGLWKPQNKTYII